jgi:hypothetical protein
VIDIKKRHETADGQRVLNLHYVPFNSAGGKVTYPIKGSIVRREKPIKLEYAIWSEDGEADVVWGNNSGDNLKEVKL